MDTNNIVGGMESEVSRVSVRASEQAYKIIPETLKKAEYQTVTNNNAPGKPVLRASTAILVLIIFLAGQLIASIIGSIFVIIKQIAGNGITNQEDLFQGLTLGGMPVIVFASAIGGAVALAAGANLVRKSLQDNSLFGAAWQSGKPKAIITSVFLGAGAALMYMVISSLLINLFSFEAGQKGGPLTQMAAQPGFGLATIIFLALFIAPFAEEFLFRGILLGGLNRSFGIWWGIIISNLLFIILHFTEAIYFWPAFLGIGLLSAMATWLRLTQKAIGPAVAVHFGYNLLMMGLTVIAKADGSGV
ncbi:MAG: CPBP family intramembrane metalloprotease [Deltaproteobacteria bacterium]|nr:CPBP family intramembrane metalloprotease [Deltaproteobacteria bacterium]